MFSVVLCFFFVSTYWFLSYFISPKIYRNVFLSSTKHLFQTPLLKGLVLDNNITLQYYIVHFVSWTRFSVAHKYIFYNWPGPVSELRATVRTSIFENIRIVFYWPSFYNFIYITLFHKFTKSNEIKNDILCLNYCVLILCTFITVTTLYTTVFWVTFLGIRPTLFFNEKNVNFVCLSRRWLWRLLSLNAIWKYAAHITLFHRR